MADTRKYTKSKIYPGVRWREHPTRKHGLVPDRYFVVRYRLEGKDRQESLGWASQDWTEKKANARLSTLLEAQRTGQGAVTLSEARSKAEAERKAKQEAEALTSRDGVTFAQVWGQYFPLAKQNKAARSWKKEDQCFRLWIAPVIGSKALKDVAPIHLEKIKKNMADAGRAPRSAHYCLAVVRQVFNFARDHDLFAGNNPVSKVAKPKADNRRVRFLTHEEATALLEALEERSPDVRDMALLSLNAGLRAGEVFSLTWADVDFRHGVLTLRDTKSGKTRQAPMTAEVRATLETRRGQSGGSQLVFPARGGGKIAQVSSSFERTVEDLGLNAGIEDSRQKVVFHTLRHTFASWLVQNAVPLYTVGRLLGHASLTMTERYSHLAPDHFKQAVDTLEAVRSKKPGKVVSINSGTSS